MTADKFKEQGNAAYQAGEYDKAVSLYTEGIEQEPTNAVLFSNRSAAYLNLGFYDKAIRDADMCIELDSSWSKGWWRKGTAQIENQDYNLARSTFNEGLKHCPGDSNLMSGIEKANKYIAVVESIQGPGQLEFDLDGPPSVKPIKENGEANSTKENAPVNGLRGDTSSETETRGAENSKGPSAKTASAGGKEKSREEEAWPGTPEAEIERIKTAPNHYAVLHVSTDADSGQMKKNYYTLARILHPDRCQLAGAGEAMTSVSQAYDTLSNVLKKTLYDQFLSQTGGDDEQPNQTYQEWESRQQPVEIPKWLAFLLGIRGCGYFLLLVVAVVVLPLIVLIMVIYLIIALLCLPVSCCMRVFFPERYARMKEREEREMAKIEEEAQDRMFAHV